MPSLVHRTLFLFYIDCINYRTQEEHNNYSHVCRVLFYVKSLKLCFQSAVFSFSVQCSEVSVQSSVFSMQFKCHVTHTVFSG